MNTTFIARFRTEPSDHTFFKAMGIIVTALVLTGFGRTYGRPLANGTSTVPAIVHVHAVVFATWLFVFVAQTFLAGRGTIATHRRLGTAGVVLAGVMVILGAETAIVTTSMGHRGIPGVEFPDPAGFLLLNLTNVLTFGGLVGGAWYYRNNPQTHKRLMLMALAGGLGPPGISRLPVIAGNVPATGVVVLLVVLAGLIYDVVSRRRVHPAYWFGFVVAVLPGPVASLVGPTAAWQAIASWLMR
jgi:hypothetical protein